jgi:hypothetical protein
MPTDYDTIPSPIPGYASRRALLEDLYIDQKLPISIIAMRTDQSTATISRWLVEHGISARMRGGNNASARVTWTLHRLDPRFVRVAPLSFLAQLVDAAANTIYKYRRAVLPK